jgi:hypothetical protein
MEVTVSKGFVVLAQNNNSVDYITQAYALALSIKASQHEHNLISLITNDPVPKKYQKVFDQIIPIPFNDDAENTEWKVENRWKIFHATPYDETIVLDVDMLLLEDISTWWTYCSNYDIKFCSRIRNYKLEEVYDTFHRRAFIANDLPNVYFGLHYFKKTQPAYDFYKVLEFVCNNWEWSYDHFAVNEYQKWLSMDLTAAITVDMMGLTETALDKNSPLEFVHMKVPLQGWTTNTTKWSNIVPVNLNSSGHLEVANIRQHKLFHYVEKDFITKSILKKLEDLANG